MKVTVNEILNHYSITKGKDEVVRQHVISGDKFEEIFPQIYALERSSRYDNYRHYEITDADIRNAYLEWKKYGVTIEMYYGGGTVD